MRVLIRAVGLVGPGLPDWSRSISVLRGDAAYVPAPTELAPIDALPPAERRRTGPPVRLALSTGLQALEGCAFAASDAVTVFTSSGGDGQVIHAICESLASDERDVSPTRFHNSVHNAPAGYWGIATRSHTASTSLCAFDWSFAAGLLEACAQASTTDQPVLLISYDVPNPPPLQQVRSVHGMLGIALVLGVPGTGNGLASLEVEFTLRAQNPTRMRNAELETLRAGNPTGRALPLLEALAAGATREIALEYLDATLVLRTLPA